MRRVVTGHDTSGKSIIVEDGTPPRRHDFASFPGFSSTVAWSTDADVPLEQGGTDPTPALSTLLPSAGQTRLIVLTLPPDSSMAEPTFDGPGYAAEQLRHSPGLAETFEADGMHTTPTIDYTLVLDGVVTLELDNGVTTDLHPGDLVVQNATRHGWRNRTERPVTVAFVLIGTEQKD
ncbi:cupin [Rhodococcus sp. 06-462-5]|uniref:cupin domain-containing protein n=1 Tax=unclassified Rhodococcus (in: high G+C Gram-positive bacteria) TaxID=192944 RepID=UPI000B9BC6CF|nr:MULTISPECIES: cupin domain-containing protein [unclassified Rhodococcus (in: high G+C Gram-positive bacteria)]OZC73632.1 cupin [Rhodococcus sp. 06-462-5]OZE63441.1 cupin [Rhodococcus sp. 02-925g]